VRVPLPLRIKPAGLFALSFLTAACGISAGHGPGATESNGVPGSTGARVERRELDRHPPINLVARLGDPLPALAFASVHDNGSVGSVALSALLLARLQAHGLTDIVSIPNDTGIELAALSSDAAPQAFIAEISAALATPIAEHDDALALIEQHLAALGSRRFAGRAEASVASCSGELGLPAGAALPDVRSAAGRAQLEKYRRFAYSTRASAFAAVGSSAFLDAAYDALSKTADWPTGDAPEDDWPSADAIGVDAAEGTRHLSVALRLADADATLAALPALTENDAPLSARLRTFFPGFRVERVAFHARPRGACLRVDVLEPAEQSGVPANDASRATQLVTEELRAALLAHAQSARVLDENIIEPSDPRQAAARAAYRALVARLEPGAPRRLVALTAPASEQANFSVFPKLLMEAESHPPRAPLEVRQKSEPGQGEVWLLVGSPCGTLGESNEDAGQTALALTLAAQDPSNGVALEPWLTADAVGLLAHAPRNAGEGAQQQAERVARALARALTARDASGNGLASAQNQLFGELGGEPRPGYARLLDALSPDHSAWLEPRGTWAALAQANRDSVGARGRDLLRGPLRIAVLGNQDDAQAAAAAHAFESWLAPFRDDPRRCQATAEHAARTGEISITTPTATSHEVAYVGVPLPSRLKYAREAEAFAVLLNAPGGPLARALVAANLNASARARVIGGERAAALVLEIHAAEEDARAVTLEVRRAWERLAASPLSAEDLAVVQRESDARALAASLDPRRRIVDLWRGSTEAKLSASGLRAFQASLSPTAEVVVYVTRKD